LAFRFISGDNRSGLRLRLCGFPFAEGVFRLPKERAMRLPFFSSIVICILAAGCGKTPPSSRPPPPPAFAFDADDLAKTEIWVWSLLDNYRAVEKKGNRAATEDQQRMIQDLLNEHRGKRVQWSLRVKLITEAGVYLEDSHADASRGW